MISTHKSNIFACKCINRDKFHGFKLMIKLKLEENMHNKGDKKKKAHNHPNLLLGGQGLPKAMPEMRPRNQTYQNLKPDMTPFH